jgi:hypothetical protein
MPKSEPSEMLRTESDEELAVLQIEALEDLAARTEAAAREARVKVIEMGRMLAEGYGAAAELWNSLTARTMGDPIAES